MSSHPLQRLYLAEDLVRRRRADEYRRHVASQRAARIDPNPHQIDAVYNRFLEQKPLRFLLADDPGAGKTIMTGLYVRESLSRRTIRRVLVVAPMSGHHSTLLRGTVEAMLPDHGVYITDWIDAKLVPLAAGKFDLEDYITYVMEFIRLLGPDVHVMAICQPAPPVLCAVALLAERDDPAQPRSMTLMGGPIDTRRNPTAVNDLAAERGIDWFRNNVITKVPFPHPGVMRDVYPGFLQLNGFISMNLDRHMDAHKALFANLVKGDGDLVDKHREFYDEYLAVMDLTAEQTAQRRGDGVDESGGQRVGRGRGVDDPRRPVGHVLIGAREVRERRAPVDHLGVSDGECSLEGDEPLEEPAHLRLPYDLPRRT